MYYNLILLVTLVVLGSAAEFENCNSDEKRIVFEQIAVSPNPLSLREDSSYSIESKISILKPIGEEVKLSVTFKKHIRFGFLVPIRIEKFDSICNFLTDNNYGFFARLLFNKNENDPCTIEPTEEGKTLDMQFKMTIKWEEINLDGPTKFLIRNLGYGSYELEVNFVDKNDNKNVGCLKVKNIIVG